MCPIVVGSFVLNNNLRYEGKAFYAMIGLVTGGIINILGDYLLIKIIPLGVLGAGIATAASQFISFLILVYFHNKMAQGKIRMRYVSRKFTTYFTICRVGFPALIRQGLNSVSSGILNNLTRPYGDAAIAAMSVVNRFTAFVMCVGLGVGQGFQPVAAFNYQARKYSRVKKGLLVTMGVGLCMICCLAVPGFVFAEQVVYLFQKSPQVIEIGTVALRWSCAGVTFLALSVPINMLYQSTRQVAMSSFLSILRNGLVLIPLLFITSHFWGLNGIRISQALADMLTGFISIPFVLSFLRKKFEDS